MEILKTYYVHLSDRSRLALLQISQLLPHLRIAINALEVILTATYCNQPAHNNLPSSRLVMCWLCVLVNHGIVSCVIWNNLNKTELSGNTDFLIQKCSRLELERPILACAFYKARNININFNANLNKRGVLIRTGRLENFEKIY